jgi:anti-anti-sigma factor
MIVEKSKVGECTLLSIEGVIKLGESARFLAEGLQRALDEETGHVLIDFSRINYMDSTGIGELVGYLGRFRDLDRKMVLINPSDRILRLLSIAQIESLFVISPDIESALAAVC